MSTAKKEEQRFKREELERRKNATFFVFEMVLLCIVSGACLLALFGDFSLYLKGTCVGLLGFIVRSITHHLTNRI